MSVRISLIDRLAVETNGTRLDEQRFPGRQGRIVFAYLVVQHGRAVPRDELAELLWGEDLPATWEKALRVLVTKLRSLLEECGIERTTGLASAFGCYTLTLPAATWIDVDAAKAALERAEAAFAAGDLDEARAQAAVAAGLSRPTFLPGEDGAWVEEQRRDLRDILVRALECLRNATLAAGESGDAVRYAAEITELEPFRESSYRALMQAHVAAGNPAEALRVYERCRRFLADELGAYPAAETEANYRELLRSSPGTIQTEAERVGDAGIEAELAPRPSDKPPRPRSRRVGALLTAVVFVGVVAVAAGLALVPRGKHPPVIRANSLVRLDPETLRPTQVIRIGPLADLVVVAGGYVWTTHGLLRHKEDSSRHNAGYRTVMRSDPTTGKAERIGELAPCGIVPDPSGDVWVANCYASGRNADVTRVHATTEDFDKPLTIPDSSGFYSGMTYGGGSLWVGESSGQQIEQLDPRSRTGSPRSIRVDRQPTALAWSGDYGNLWMTNFDDGSVTRMNVETRKKKTFESVANQPGPLAVHNDAVWVGDWDVPSVTRLPAVGAGPMKKIPLPAVASPAGVTSIAATDEAIWVAVPEDHSVMRIDPKTNKVTRIAFQYEAWGVAVGANDGGIWVALRGRKAT